MKRFLVLCSLFLLLPVAGRAAAPTFIGEIAWAGSAASTADEWLELCGPAGADLSGWTIDGAGTGDSPLTLPAGSMMSSNGAFLIANYGNGDPKSTLAASPDWTTTAVALSNSALFLTLRDVSGAAIDVAGQPGAAPFAGATGAGKASMERLFPLVDGGTAQAWASASASVGFDAGASELGTPGTCPSAPETSAVTEGQAPIVSATETLGVAEAEVTGPPTAPAPAAPTRPASAVRISEAYPVPSAGEHEWIELVDPSDVGEVLDGWTLEDGKGTATALSGTLLPWSRLLVASPRGRLNDDGDLIVLKDASGRAIDGVAYGIWDSPYPNVGEVRKGESLMRLEMQDAFAVTTTPTPGGANALTGRAQETSTTAMVTPLAAIAPAPKPTVTAVAAPSAAAASPSKSPAIAATQKIATQKPAAVKKPAAPKYKGRYFKAIVASPPGVYSKTRFYALIAGAVREMRLSKAPDAKYAAGERVAFVAQEKTDGADPYLLANPNSIRRLDASASATFAIAEAWPDQAGAYRLNAEVVSLQAGTLEAKLGGVEGDVLAPAALTDSLKPGDIVTIEGYVAPGPRPRAVLARPEALTLFKAFQAEAPPKAPAAKLPWQAAAGLTLLTALVGLYAYLRHQRLQRLAHVLSPVDADEEA